MRHRLVFDILFLVLIQNKMVLRIFQLFNPRDDTFHFILDLSDSGKFLLMQLVLL